MLFSKVCSKFTIHIWMYQCFLENKQLEFHNKLQHHFSSYFEDHDCKRKWYSFCVYRIEKIFQILISWADSVFADFLFLTKNSNYIILLQNADNLAWGSPASTPNLTTRRRSSSQSPLGISHDGSDFELNPLRGSGGGPMPPMQSSINLQRINETSSKSQYEFALHYFR